MRNILYIVQKPCSTVDAQGEEQDCFAALFSVIETARHHKGRIIFCGGEDDGAFMARCENFARISGLVSFSVTQKDESLLSLLPDALHLVQRKGLLQDLDEIHVFVRERDSSILDHLQELLRNLHVDPAPRLGLCISHRDIPELRPRTQLKLVSSS